MRINHAVGIDKMWIQRLKEIAELVKDNLFWVDEQQLQLQEESLESSIFKMHREIKESSEYSFGALADMMDKEKQK